MTVHYNVHGWPVCGAKSQNLTYVLRKVTCLKCKQSRDYREMMETR